MHPDLESLIRYNDGETREREGKKLEKHLAKCAKCRRELELLRAAADSANVPVPPASAVLAGIDNWSAEQRRQGIDVEVVKRRVAAEIRPFLGETATGGVLRAVSAQGENLLSVIEPVLALFLGRDAARQFVSHVVDAAIVRI